MVSNGDYKVNLELANNKITANNDVAITNRTKKPYRYNLNSTGKFDFDRFLTANLDINTVGDRDYLRDYHNTYLAYTVSQADVDYIKGRSHSSLSSVRFQELENPLLQNQAPLVLPRFNSHIETAKPLISNERYFLNTDLAILTREEGLQYQRISLEPGVRLPFNIAGNLFDLEAKSQNDYYHLTGDLANPESSAQNFKSYISNQKNKFNAKWSLPLIKKTDPSTLMVEPIAMLSSTSYKGDYTKIPNQDSANGELSMNNLFSDNRISGYDRSETGERVSYGARSSLFNSLGEFEFNFGQSYRLSNQSQDVTVLGFNATNKSSVVGDFFYKASKHFTMRYDFQLNDSTFLNEINDVNANLVFDRFSFNTSYLLMRRTASNDIKKEQVQLISGIKLTKQWSTQLMLVRDLTNGINLNRSIALKYDGCCTIVDFTVSEQDLGNLTAPNRSFSFSVTVKNLTVM